MPGPHLQTQLRQAEATVAALSGRLVAEESRTAALDVGKTEGEKNYFDIPVLGGVWGDGLAFLSCGTFFLIVLTGTTHTPYATSICDVSAITSGPDPKLGVSVLAMPMFFVFFWGG